VVDCFKDQSKVGRNVAIEGLRELQRTGKSTPAELQRAAAEVDQWTLMRPYVEAIAHDG
jgi:hypothetical protein